MNTKKVHQTLQSHKPWKKMQSAIKNISNCWLSPKNRCFLKQSCPCTKFECKPLTKQSKHYTPTGQKLKNV